MLKEIANLIGTEVVGIDTLCTGVAIDSRSISKGDLFVALKGERVDGHAFISEAEARGASGVLVSEAVQTTLPVLQVSDTLKALGQFAKSYRNRFDIPIIAVTGSCGKTTVKEMSFRILSKAGSVLANKGNLNTEIGVPLTLLKLKPEHQMAVIEMGARQQGDIAYLMQLVSPTVSIITNAGVAHMEIFGSEQGIAKAKGEIYQYLKKDGIAVINADDQHAPYWRSLLQGQRVITFGLDAMTDVTSSHLIEEPTHSSFELVTDAGSIKICLPVPGKHNVMNALTAAAGALGISLEHIQAGLQSFVPVAGRLQNKVGLMGARIIDDSYNANPASVRAALTVLSQYPGQKICILGDMFELGPKTADLHYEMGVLAKQLKIDKLLCVGSHKQRNHQCCHGC